MQQFTYQLNNIITYISMTLKVSTFDVYLMFFILVISIILMILWSKVIFESLFGMIVGLSIFIVLHFLLLNNQCTNWCITQYIDIKLINFIVWSSSYLIFILSIIAPVYGLLGFKESQNPYIKYMALIIWSVLFVLFYMTIVIWFIEKTYIFKINNFFMFFNNIESFKAMKASSKIYGFLLRNIQLITVLWVFYTFYKLLFSEMVNSMLAWLIKYIKEKAAQKWWSWNDSSFPNNFE